MPFRALRIGYASGVHATGPLYDKMRKPVKWFLKVFSGPLVRPPDHRVPVRLVPNTYAFYGMYNTPRISYTGVAMRETQEERGNEMKTERVKGPIAKTSMCGCDGESRCVLHTEERVRPFDPKQAAKDLRGAQKMIAQATERLQEHSDTWKEADGIWEAL